MKSMVPGTFVPGAVYLSSTFGKKHKWQMPKPVAFVERLQVVEEVVFVDDKPRRNKVKKKVQFPVYRGMAASLARSMRAEIRRNQRKAQEARVKAQKVDVRNMLHEFVTTGEIQNA